MSETNRKSSVRGERVHSQLSTQAESCSGRAAVTGAGEGRNDQFSVNQLDLKRNAHMSVRHFGGCERREVTGVGGHVNE